MEDTITIKQLASQAGMEVRTLRRILRAKFPRDTRGKAYEWEASDPQVDLILKAAADHKGGSRKISYSASETKTAKPTTEGNSSDAKLDEGEPKTQKPEATKAGENSKPAQKGGETNNGRAANS